MALSEYPPKTVTIKAEPMPVYYWKFCGEMVSPTFHSLKHARDWWAANTPVARGVYTLVKHAGGIFKDVMWANEYVD
jgi:hypothetical protein